MLRVGAEGQQVLKQRRFVTTLVRCPRKLTLVYINNNLVELMSLCVVLLKVTEPINDTEGLL